MFQKGMYYINCVLNSIIVTVVTMLDHPITVVLNVFHTCKNTWLKVYKFMSIQNQEEHIGHVKQP